MRFFCPWETYVVNLSVMDDDYPILESMPGLSLKIHLIMIDTIITHEETNFLAY